MPATRLRRSSDSALVDSISRVTYEGDPADGDGPDVTLPDGLWDIVVFRHRGRVQVLQTGVITRPVDLAYDPGDEYFAISFRPGVVMPRLPGARMLDRGVLRPNGTRTFRLDGDTFEIPTFENADVLVDRLVRREIVVIDELVAGVADGDPAWASERTVQRRFRWALGLSPKQFHQIRRASRAVELLRTGRTAADVASELDYADQPHLIRSLRRFTGRTPRQLAAPAIR
jgi:hypothetical protein